MGTLRRGRRPRACVRLTRFVSGGCPDLSGRGSFEESIPLVQVFLVPSKFSPPVRRRQECRSGRPARIAGIEVLVDPGKKASSRGSGMITKGGCRSAGERQGYGPGRGGTSVPSGLGSSAAPDSETRLQGRSWSFSGPAFPSIGIDSPRLATPGPDARRGGTDREDGRLSFPLRSMAPRGSRISKEEGL